MTDMLATSDKIIETMRKHNPGGDLIGAAELTALLTNLDPASGWTEDKVKVALSTAGSDADGRANIETFIRSLCASSVDYTAVRKDLNDIMDSPTWDDGSYAPLLIRLAWHSSGTYNKTDGTGGSNGATMRHAVEAGDPENAGLDHARKYLEPVKAKYPWLSYADLWILASYVALERTGGPVVPFTGGRFDGSADRAIAPGRLPGAEKGLAEGFDLDEEGRFKGWENLAQHIRDVFGRMGLSDKEAVALICGGHVYGRCHTTSSGYNGAWVENPTLFSNEYAADMVGDKWIAVTHDTKMPDGGPVPEEVRPAPGKRQYIDLSKYMPEEEEQEARAAPDATNYPPGVYKCLSQWVNCREQPNVESAIIGRFNQEQVLSLVSVKVFGTAIRGQCERGGWVSIVGSGGKQLFGREGDLDLKSLKGTYRAVLGGGAPVFATTSSSEGSSRTAFNEEFQVEEVALGTGAQADALLGKNAQGSWVLLFSPSQGLTCELIVPGYNEKPRKAIVGQTGHQMMLVSDMVLLWDKGFREHLDVYAEDEDKLKEDFGTAYLRLTELGCPWSQDYMVRVAGQAPVPVAMSGGCPFSGVKA